MSLWPRGSGELARLARDLRAVRPTIKQGEGSMSTEEEVRQLHGECADLLRTLDRVRRIVYDRLDGQGPHMQETARLLLAAVNAPAERSVLQPALSARGRPLWLHEECGGVQDDRDSSCRYCEIRVGWKALYIMDGETA